MSRFQFLFNVKFVTEDFAFIELVEKRFLGDGASGVELEEGLDFLRIKTATQEITINKATAGLRNIEIVGVVSKAVVD